MVSKVIRKDKLTIDKVYLCRICKLKVKTNSVLYVRCGKWIHSRCARVKIVPSIDFN